MFRVIYFIHAPSILPRPGDASPPKDALRLEERVIHLHIFHEVGE
jgi:hypothetical protein